MRPCRPFYFLIRRDNDPILRGFAHVLQTFADGGIGGPSLADEVRLDRADLSHSSLPGGSAVKVDFDRLAANPRKVLQETHEFQLIIRFVEAKSKFWNQVMTVNQEGHTPLY